MHSLIFCMLNDSCDFILNLCHVDLNKFFELYECVCLSRLFAKFPVGLFMLLLYQMMACCKHGVNIFSGFMDLNTLTYMYICGFFF